MKTYKQSVLLAVASRAASIKVPYGDSNITLWSEGEEGQECNLWWNDIYQPCRQGLECRDQGPDSIDGFGICDDPRKLGNFFEICDTWVDGFRIAGCKDEFECLDFNWFGQSQVRLCLYPREYVGWQEQCGFNEHTGRTTQCESGLVCEQARHMTICYDEPAGLNETCEGFNENTGRPFPRCEDGLVCNELGNRHIPGMGKRCELSLPQQGPKSEAWSDSVMLFVENWTDREVQLYWYDYDGNPIPYGIIQPGDTVTQQTFATHPWEARVTDGSGAELLINGRPVYTPGTTEDQFLQIETPRY